MDEISKSEDSVLSFEDFRQENGITYWWASDLMGMLGYKDMKSFHKVLDRATKALVSLGIPHYENIISQMRDLNGELIQDFKLTRFACYISVMNGDPRRTEVANAQAYFAEQTRKFELYIQDQNEIDRILIRDELTEGNKSLTGLAKQSGVINYAYFQDAGYRGLYNMNLNELRRKRKIDPKVKNIADLMGRTELAANLFRITQTEERIKSKNVFGQTGLERTHYEVGREVRGMVQRNVGKNPENLELEKELPEIKKELKQGYKKMLKDDCCKKKLK